MKARILLIDDEEMVRQSLEDILRLEGYDITGVAGGEEGLAILGQASFDLVLLDLKMPGIDGIEVLHRIINSSPDTKVIFLTGHGSLESAIEALRHGAKDYLLKPVSSRDLLNSVSNAVTARNEQQQKRLLLEQLDISVQRLKTAEGLDTSNADEHQMIALDGGVTIDLARREMWRGNQRVTFTPTEGKLMKVLVENRNRVLSHSELVLLVQGYEATDWEAPEVLRPLISRLRRKLSIFPNGEKWIANVRGTGYVFELYDATGAKL